MGASEMVIYNAPRCFVLKDEGGEGTTDARDEGSMRVWVDNGTGKRVASH